MTRQLHEVLTDIASDVPNTDLVAGVAERASRLRWLRRGIVSGAAVGVAALVGLVTVVLPSWQESTRPDREIPATQPTIPVMAPEINLDAAEHGVLSGPATALVAVADEDGTELVALDVKAGRAVRLDTPIPAGLETVDLAHGGTRALLTTGITALVVDVVSGEILYEHERQIRQPVALTWDGSSLITYEGSGLVTGPPGTLVTPSWQLTLIDIETGEATKLGAPELRSSVSGQIFATPDPATIFVRYDGSVRDSRLHRVDLTTGTKVFSEAYGFLRVESLHWPDDGTKIEAELASAVRMLSPTNEIGDLISSMRKLGDPLGFAGPEHLVWWRGGVDGGDLVLSDLRGIELQETTTLSTSGTLVAITTELG